MTIEDLRQMNEEGKFPQKFSEEELQKIHLKSTKKLF